ncbi:MAG: ABC transporter ATP-binding protein [Planctomycetes bacterium]|nr:ABC transporter ATP-binding protein [Planctomycetota bacterium]
MSDIPNAIEVSKLSHHYGQRQALCDLDLTIRCGEIFAVVGPNGGGKTTLFRILSTLVPPQTGRVMVLGLDVASQTSDVRTRIGVVFQSPALDRQLSVAENLSQQGRLYGMTSREIADRGGMLLEQLRLTDRRRERVDTLSGGLRRRVELAKGLLHGPQLLLLDEPSTGLDPAARRDLWDHLSMLKRDAGVTVVLTTHILEEAEQADRVAIIDGGKVVAIDTPDALRCTVGGDAITVRTADAAALAAAVSERFGCQAQVVDGAVRLEQPDGHQWIAKLVEAFPGKIEAITYARPSLEDVFIDRTGRRFERDVDPPMEPTGRGRRKSSRY